LPQDIEISGLPLKKAEISEMMIQQRLLKFITIANWGILFAAAMIAMLASSADFARGVIFGGLIVTVNFHLLYRTLQKAFRPQQLVSHNVVLAKYYVRFIASGVIILILIAKHYVNPIGLFIGLSVVVVSITLATLIELKNLFFKEAV
jgi:hypothetical protein